MSRPSLFGRPLTNAEKQARWRRAHPCICGRPGPMSPGRTGGLLDLPVRTDTSNVVRYLGVSGVGVPECAGDPVGMLAPLGGVAGPYLPVRCDVCGLPLKDCRCIAGIDY